MINRVNRVICQRKNEFISLPTSNEMRMLADKTFEEFRIPNAPLAIDGTHVRLARYPSITDFPPGSGLEVQSFTNRKWYASLNVMVS